LYEKYFDWDGSLLKCNKDLHKVDLIGVIAKISQTVKEISEAGSKDGYSDQDYTFDMCFQ